MNIKSLIATFALVVGTSSVALAKPAVTVQAEASWSFSTSPAPVVVRDHRRNPTPAPVVVRDHRNHNHVAGDDCDDHPSYRAPARLASWYRPQPLFISRPQGTMYVGTMGTLGYGNAMVALSQPTRIDNNREDFIVKQHGFDTIQLRGVAGSTYVTRVTIDFGHGIPAQIITLNRNLRAGEAITIDVNGRSRTVNRIFVYGTSGSGSAYQLFAN